MSGSQGGLAAHFWVILPSGTASTLGWIQDGRVTMEQDSIRTDKTTTPSVAIDGARIRSVREAKKLTQLYVANVVGVTTDTISRWENNRYPTIKRDNAEKLASALEVDLAEILRLEETSPITDTTSPAPAPRSSRRLLVIGLALSILFLGLFFLSRSLVPAPRAVRWTPRFAAPGEIIPIQIKITRQGAENSGFILKEELPKGWKLVRAVPASSSADPTGSGIKWLIPGGSVSVTVSYTVQVPPSPTPGSEASFKGEIVLHAGELNRTKAVTGTSALRIGAYHWADTNGDARIDDDEIMPAYYLCEEMKGLDLDWKTVEAIWSSKGYRWNPKEGYTVLK
jgi:transcriptional regulator with XRE-family HTH domain